MKSLPDDNGRQVEGIQQALSFQRPSFPQKYYSTGVKVGLHPESSGSQSPCSFHYTMMSQSRGMLGCVCDNSSFPVVRVFPHWLFHSITQFLEGKN